MKTRATFYIYSFGGDSFIEFEPRLETFQKGFGFDIRTRANLCRGDLEKVTGIKLPRNGLFKATLIIKRIGQRGLRK